MNGIKSEWPLLVFTVCAPLCAGAWAVASLLALIDAFPEAGSLVSGACGAAVCALLILALCCSTLHLGKPFKALRAFMRLGNSTVSNEVFMGALFAVSLIVYLAVAGSLPVSGEMGKILLAFVAAFAILFVLFQCLAYRMRTVTTWNSLAFSVEFALIALLGGVCAVGVLACSIAFVPPEVRLGLAIAAAASCVGMVVLVVGQGVVVAESVSMKRGAKALCARWGALGAVRVLAVVSGSVVWGCGMLASEPMPALAGAGFAIVLAGIVIGRYAFYRSYVNVGLPRA